MEQVAIVLDALPVLPPEAGVDHRYAAIRAALERAGTPIVANNTLIAANAAFLGLTLVTDNTRKFGEFQGSPSRTG